ncbi:hypothetical protein [Micromonospora sp. WMMD980]|uniref:hypothetical protein n=1 Tax=Micromonospora sp. WMMD980 TaxID=3016088 RepID=UPI0024178CCD|nr:hypothetical protein [Micromonospora sp. WMMD980]MDG4799291.1 hypothetical protein [Micromonospora sp. WMMD980]
MRLPYGLLVASVAAGLLSVAAALLAMRTASLRIGLVMLLALVGHVLASPGVRRVRWAVAAGVGLRAVATATRLIWYQEQADDAGWPTTGQGLARAALAAHWREQIDRERLAALGVALGVLCLAVGVAALPSRGRWRCARERTTCLGCRRPSRWQSRSPGRGWWPSVRCAVPARPALPRWTPHKGRSRGAVRSGRCR